MLMHGKLYMNAEVRQVHEATIAQSIINIASSRMRDDHSLEAVLNIEVGIGEFRNVDPDSLTFAFDWLKASQKPLSACHLSTRLIAAQALCRGSQHKYRPSADLSYRCPLCREGMGKLLAGEELDILGMTFQQHKEQENGNA